MEMEEEGQKGKRARERVPLVITQKQITHFPYPLHTTHPHHPARSTTIPASHLSSDTSPSYEIAISVSL